MSGGSYTNFTNFTNFTRGDNDSLLLGPIKHICGCKLSYSSLRNVVIYLFGCVIASVGDVEGGYGYGGLEARANAGMCLLGTKLESSSYNTHELLLPNTKRIRFCRKARKNFLILRRSLTLGRSFSGHSGILILGCKAPASSSSSSPPGMEIYRIPYAEKLQSYAAPLGLPVTASGCTRE